MNNRIYLDYNACAPILEDARKAILKGLDLCANPSSIHFHGRQAEDLIEEARLSVAAYCDVNISSVVFTSGGTEAANLALLGGQKAYNTTSFLYAPIEHPCVADTIINSGFDYKELLIEKSGYVSLENLQQELSNRPQGSCILAIQAVNSETGIIQPLEQINKTVKPYQAKIIVDASQAAGKILIEHISKQADLLFFCGQKIGAGQSTGVIVGEGVEILQPIMYGGGQERRVRPGTQNVAGIAAMGAACYYSRHVYNNFVEHSLKMQKLLEDAILKEISGTMVVGVGSNRVSNTTYFIIDQVDGNALTMALDVEGYSVSAGTACSSGTSKNIPYLKQMGFESSAVGIRVSTGLETSENDILGFLRCLKSLQG